MELSHLMLQCGKRTKSMYNLFSSRVCVAAKYMDVILEQQMKKKKKYFFPSLLAEVSQYEAKLRDLC